MNLSRVLLDRAAPPRTQPWLKLAALLLVVAALGLADEVPVVGDVPAGLSAVVLGAIFLWYAWRLWKHYDDLVARKTFAYSIIYLSLLFVADTAWARVVPTTQSWDALQLLAQEGIRDAQTFMAPVAPFPGMVLLAVGAVGALLGGRAVGDP